jgi:hypothetical protein
VASSAESSLASSLREVAHSGESSLREERACSSLSLDTALPGQLENVQLVAASAGGDATEEVDNVNNDVIGSAGRAASEGTERDKVTTSESSTQVETEDSAEVEVEAEEPDAIVTERMSDEKGRMLEELETVVGEIKRIFQQSNGR